MAPTYWLDLFTYKTWTEFLSHGGTITGFRETRWKTAQAMKAGDVLLCYLTGISRWVGLLEVTGPAYKDESPIWSDADFPVRVPVKVLAKLDPLHAVPVLDMKDQLSFFAGIKSPHAWTGWFRSSPSKWKQDDGDAVVQAIRSAVANPVPLAFDAAKLNKVPPILKAAKGGAVTVPEDDSDEGSDESEVPSDPPLSHLRTVQRGR